MRPLIEIQTIPIEIQMKTTNAHLEYARGTAQMEVSRDRRGLQIRSQPIRVNIDTFEARSSIVPTTAQSIQQGAAQGQRAAAPILRIRQPHGVQHARHRVLARHALAYAAAFQVLLHAQTRIEAGALDDGADARALALQLARLVRAEQAHLALRGKRQPAQQLEQQAHPTPAVLSFSVVSR